MDRWDRDDPMRAATDPAEIARELKRSEERAERLKIKSRLAKVIVELEEIKKVNETQRSVDVQLVYDALADLNSALAGHTRTVGHVAGQSPHGH